MSSAPHPVANAGRDDGAVPHGAGAHGAGAHGAGARGAGARGAGARGAGGERAGAAIALYVVGCFLAAAVAAPAIYLGVQAATEHLPLLAPLARHPLYRYLHRLLTIFALLGLPALLRALGMRSWRDVGLTRFREHRRAFALAAAFGAATVAAAAAAPLLAGARAFKDDLTAGGLLLRAAGALGVALVVATLEELLFRGVFYGGLRRWRAPGHRAPAVALAASSAFYALVHFLTRPPNPETVTWDTGFVLLGGMLAGLVDPRMLVPSFLTLFVLGASLAGLYRRTGTLWASVGLHAGGIFVLQLYGYAVASGRDAPDRWLWGSGLLLDGWVGFAALLAAAAAGAAALRRRDRARGAAPDALMQPDAA